MADLKPCPFCWKPGTIWESRKLVPGYHDACRAVGCKACAYTLASKSETTTWLETGGCTTNTEEVDALLASIWNTRVSPWRSLKDDPPKSAPILVRKERGPDIISVGYTCDVMTWITDGALATVISRGYSEWMEIPS